jgi:hypothetical protein
MTSLRLWTDSNALTTGNIQGVSALLPSHA